VYKQKIKGKDGDRRQVSENTLNGRRVKGGGGLEKVPPLGSRIADEEISNQGQSSHWICSDEVRGTFLRVLGAREVSQGKRIYQSEKGETPIVDDRSAERRGKGRGEVPIKAWGETFIKSWHKLVGKRDYSLEG